jgi:hypothetical protein
VKHKWFFKWTAGPQPSPLTAGGGEMTELEAQKYSYQIVWGVWNAIITQWQAESAGQGKFNLYQGWITLETTSDDGCKIVTSVYWAPPPAMITPILQQGCHALGYAAAQNPTGQSMS